VDWIELAPFIDSDGLLCIFSFAFYKFLGLFRLNAKLLASEVELCCVELFVYKHCIH